MSKFNQHPATDKIKNNWAIRPKDRKPTLEQIKEQQRLKKLRKKRIKGGKRV